MDKKDFGYLPPKYVDGVEELHKRLNDAYKKAIRIKPNSAKTYMLLGNAHYLKGEIEQAIASYKTSINIEPENDEYRLVYTQVLDEYIDKKRNGEPV